jgi:hypothetical protein
MTNVIRLNPTTTMTTLEQAARLSRDTDRLAALMPRAINALVRVEAMLRGAHLNSNATADEVVAVINEWHQGVKHE